MATITPPPFRGLWVPLVTPFRKGAVDHQSLGALTRSLAQTGIAGFVICGSTGEPAALDEDEQLACLNTVARHAGDRPLVMGVSGYHLDAVSERVRRLTALAASDVPSLCGLLVPAPHYVRPSQDGLRLWFETLADASGLPLIVYDIPYRTGAVIARETLLALAAHANIHAVKDCGGDAGKTLALIRDGRLAVLSGEDLQMFNTLAQGGAGAIAASAHLHTDRFVALVNALEQGDLASARAVWRAVVPLIEGLFAEPNPAPIKALLARRGWMTPELRMPLTGISPTLQERLSAMDSAL
ncbi:4-hydroxy-tetrahydrodipicolinate synthase [Aquabacterium sp. A7-Y]|uniref:4-hydroxy-tetrahydrodipicolinate synthase family protein n=1 Tax=Aquabacterium sp. A7-Y TaxID=1349605 RepID=UPI00223DC8EF|nr:4-hydroxy-tetrahydrodipicolinate synthase [Aquabacterium sp. A7-Y]MCW7538025.1 4-hydroxy-tetrahydrodipicolinate synthase [Aquabacterium sp. A7-Y]